MEENRQRVRSAPTFIEELPFPEGVNTFMHPGPTTYPNVNERPAIGDIVTNAYGDDFIVLCTDRLDPLHCWHDEKDPSVGVMPTETWKNAVKSVNALDYGDLTQESKYAYRNSKGKWTYRLPVISVFIGVSNLKLKKRTPRPPPIYAPRVRTPVQVHITRTRTPVSSPTQTTQPTRIRTVCIKPSIG
jgi:hypothetical protein